MIPYGRQEITQEDIDAVVQILQSDFLTQGPTVPRFEDCVSHYCTAQHCIAVNSATSALHIACLSLGLGEGDYLWTSPITFVASANCGLYCGAKVDFVDIDPCSWNMCPHALEEKLQQAEEQGKLPKIVIPVHLSGQSCEMEAIHALSKRYGFHIIEDASHAIGGKYKDTPVGSCTYSDIVIFSFHPVKIITTGEGGMALTNNEELANSMRLLRSHGITRDQQKMTKESEGPWYYQQIALGYNYRMTDIQAALGLSQMSRLDQYVLKRNQLATRYDSAFAETPITTQQGNAASYSAMHLYLVEIPSTLTKESHSAVFNKLLSAGIGVNLHYIPVHLQPYFQKLGFAVGDFPIAENYYQRATSLPMYPTLRDVEQNTIIEALQKAIS